MKRARTVKTILSILALFVATGIQPAVAEISPFPNWAVGGTQQYEQFALISEAGDVNGDGYEDIVVGADTRGISKGYVSLFYGSAFGLSVVPAWTVVNDQDGAGFGRTTGVGDVNGDGYADILVAAPFYDNGQTDEGRVYVYYGSATGPKTTADWMIEGNQTGALLGGFNTHTKSIGGDLNKDGYDDVIISAHGYNNNSGKVSIYYGSATGLSTVPSWTVIGDQPGANFSTAAFAGDVNGDDFLDVVVGALNYSNGQTGEGRVYAFYGSASGLSTTPNWIIESNQAGARLGSSVTPAGDVNGDGYDDVVVAAYDYNNGVSGEGAAFVYYGLPTGLSTTPAWTFSSGQAGACMGWVNTVGDINNDGYDDIIVGTPWYDGGRGIVWLFLGSSTGLSSTPYWTAQSDLPGAHYSWPSGAVDVNGDGAKDIYVGAHTYPNGESKGRAYVYYGKNPSTTTTICDADYWENLYENCQTELQECQSQTTTTTVPPTLIEMSSLTATPANQKVKLEWKTEAERDNAGFNVWRAEGFTKISHALIPAQGSPTFGAEYDFVDDLVFNGKQYFYLIEDIDNGGISTFHGPVKTTPRMIYVR